MMDQESKNNNHETDKPLDHSQYVKNDFAQNESVEDAIPSDPSLSDPSIQESNDDSPESLFEHYEPRSASIILSQKNAQQRASVQAQLDSQAAEAAAIILDGVEPPEFDFDQETVHHQLLPTASQQEASAIRVQKTSLLGQLRSPGAQFVYALIIITMLAGLIGLAASTDSPVLVLIAGIASPMLLPICIWKWIRWLDSTPYYYRLLTSLGEDARNLLNYRLLWKRSS